MTTQIVNYNDKILKNYQKDFPNLVNFSYDEQTDSLIYLGNSIKLNGYGLSRINPVFFNLLPEDIFTFFKDGFYQETNENIQIQNLFNQFVITEEEISFINNYAHKFIDRFSIYQKNSSLFDKYAQNESIQNFLKQTEEAAKIIKEVESKYNIHSNDALSILNEAYQKAKNINIFSTSQNVNLSNEQGLKLTRKLSSYEQFQENEQYLQKLNQENKLGMAGFSSLILVISSAITFGMYIAIQLLK